MTNECRECVMLLIAPVTKWFRKKTLNAANKGLFDSIQFNIYLCGAFTAEVTTKQLFRNPGRRPL